jgi:hypothetical protein
MWYRYMFIYNISYVYNRFLSSRVKTVLWRLVALLLEKRWMYQAFLLSAADLDSGKQPTKKQGFGSVFIFLLIRIQRIRMEANTDPDPIRIQGFNDQKLKKNNS